MGIPMSISHSDLLTPPLRQAPDFLQSYSQTNPKEQPSISAQRKLIPTPESIDLTEDTDDEEVLAGDYTTNGVASVDCHHAAEATATSISSMDTTGVVLGLTKETPEDSTAQVQGVTQMMVANPLKRKADSIAGSTNGNSSDEQPRYGWLEGKSGAPGRWSDVGMRGKVGSIKLSVEKMTKGGKKETKEKAVEGEQVNTKAAKKRKVSHDTIKPKAPRASPKASPRAASQKGEKIVEIEVSDESQPMPVNEAMVTEHNDKPCADPKQIVSHGQSRTSTDTVDQYESEDLDALCTTQIDLDAEFDNPEIVAEMEAELAEEADARAEAEANVMDGDLTSPLGSLFEDAGDDD